MGLPPVFDSSFEFDLLQSHTILLSRPPARACTSHILVYWVLAVFAQLIKGLEICNATTYQIRYMEEFFNVRL